MTMRIMVNVRITIWFGEFGWEAVMLSAAEAGETVDDFVSDACRHYLTELTRSVEPRAAFRVPSRRRSEDAAAREVELRLPASVLQRMKVAAEEQQIDVADLVAHATLLWIADNESGRVAERVLRELADDAPAAPS
jgi:hypothetical protein